MSKSNKKDTKVKRLQDAIDAYVNSQVNGTFNYKQVSAALGAATPKLQRAIAMYLSARDYEG